MTSNKTKNIVLIIASIFLFIAFIDGLPYGYFVLLRFIVTGVSLFMVFIALGLEKKFFIYSFSLIALLFNPLIPIYLDREIWLFIDFIVASFMLFSIFALKTNNLRG